MAKTIARKGGYYFTDYGCGFYSIDYAGDDGVATVKQGKSYTQMRMRFNKIDPGKKPENLRLTGGWFTGDKTAALKTANKWLKEA